MVLDTKKTNEYLFGELTDQMYTYYSKKDFSKISIENVLSSSLNNFNPVNISVRESKRKFDNFINRNLSFIVTSAANNMKVLNIPEGKPYFFYNYLKTLVGDTDGYTQDDKQLLSKIINSQLKNEGFQSLNASIVFSFLTKVGFFYTGKTIAKKTKPFVVRNKSFVNNKNMRNKKI